VQKSKEIKKLIIFLKKCFENLTFVDVAIWTSHSISEIGSGFYDLNQSAYEIRTDLSPSVHLYVSAPLKL
jgi:hypothetical protein